MERWFQVGMSPLLLLLFGMDGAGESRATERNPEKARAVEQVTIAITGDIVQADRTIQARDVAALISKRPRVSVLLLIGDIVHYRAGQGGLLRYFDTYYRPASGANWGQFDSIAFPAPGNHEYAEKDAQGYFDYFAERLLAIARLPSYHGYGNIVGKGYYSVDLNGWHLISLNSNCAALSDGSCAAGSAMENWLKADLAAHATKPILAFWHAPRFSCGIMHGDDSSVAAIWGDLHAARADFVFNGHQHFYQRFRPLDSERALDQKNGLIEIITGSAGGEPHLMCPDGKDPMVEKQLGGEASVGAFFLVLGADGSYSFAYQLRSDGTIFDQGEGISHRAR
jgi:acid phosphatase type 7